MVRIKTRAGEGEKTMSDSSDPSVLPLWVTGIATILLALVAALQDLIRDALRKPRLVIKYRQQPPMFRRSAKRFIAGNQVIMEPCFDIHLLLANEGKGQARRVEAYLMAIWQYDYSDGMMKPLADFWPVRLRYDSKGTRRINVIPMSQPEYWNSAYIPSPQLATHLKGEEFVDVPGAEGDWIRVHLDVLDHPFYQPNMLVPGRRTLKVSVYSENARRVDAFLDIRWTGEWQDDNKRMLENVTVSLLDSQSSRSLGEAS